MKLVCILLVCAGCSAPKEWTCRRVSSSTEAFQSGQLQHLPTNPLVGVGVELLTGSFGTLGYLNVTCRAIPSLKGHSQKAGVALQIEEESFCFQAERMEGGQRLRLPDEATKRLMAALEREIPVTVVLDGYMSKVEPSNFSKVLRKFPRRSL